jgi:hypothetical protein
VTYRQAVQADSPVAYWRLGDATTTASDELGLHGGMYQGSCARGLTGLLDADANTAVEFDGSTCQIRPTGAFPTFPGNAPFSIEMWIALSSATNSQYLFMHEDRGAINPINGYALLNSPSGVYFERVKNMAIQSTLHAPLTARQRFHFVGVYDGAALQLYVDGAVVGAAQADATAMPSFTAPVVIGASPMSTVFAGGLIDEIALYDHALAPPRIALHHQIGTLGPQ